MHLKFCDMPHQTLHSLSICYAYIQDLFFLLNSSWKLNLRRIDFGEEILLSRQVALLVTNGSQSRTHCEFFILFILYSLYVWTYYVLFCTIICIIFTSLCKKLVKLFSRSFSMLKTQVSLRSFLQSEVKIIHIIVQNNTY